MTKRNEHADAASQEALMDFSRAWNILRSKLWLLVVCVVAALLLAGGYIVASPRVYAAKTTVQVEQAPAKVLKIEQVTTEDTASLEVMKTLEQNLTSGALLQEVISTLKLSPQQLGLPGRGDNAYSENQMIRALEQAVSVKLVRGTRLLTITVENANPKVAQEISVGIVQQYIRRSFKEQLGVSQEANRFLVEESQRLKQKLQQSEQALQAYKEQNQAVSLQDTQNITVAKLKELNAKVTEAKSARLKVESDYAQVQKVGTDRPAELLAIPSIAESKDVIEQRDKLGAQEALIANLSQRYGPLHPKYIQAQSQKKELEAGLNRIAVRGAESLATIYEAAKETEAKFEQALKEQEQKALELNKLAIPYNVLAREVESDRALYESVLTRLKETDVTKSLSQETLRVVEPARLPDRAIKPRPIFALSLALLGGLFLGVAAIFALNALDRSLGTVDAAEERLKLPALGAVPKADKRASLEKALLLLDQPQSAVAEAFRSLRTSLSLLGNESERRTFLFTSAVPGEGKTFCSVNYAASLAQQGLQTLLIDADLRLPSVHKAFFADANHAGLSDVISGQVSFDDAVRSASVDNLWILTAGNRTPNPAELLAGSGFGKLIKSVAMEFDRVVIDSAPVNAVSDTLLLVKHAQSVCVVIHAGKTPDKAVIRACHKLEEAGSRPVGFVLNQLPLHAGVGYYYHYSSGEYGRGVYGAPEPAKA